MDCKFMLTCKLCKLAYTIVAEKEDLHNWKKGMLIQEALPYLSDDERELLVSGTCGKCFDEITGCGGDL